ncbi:hypothetical protein B0T17DRAFT_621593 [Bombardia bombarda]|uniref:Uncharacterized protein n=1 Tax=Bombardia bombarda TaxID=252184 RepID=A0AA39U250_9PEZI|nr:hypothetical protein B0T17DRAFT_621593 [Bombardia bombarda]
MRYAALLIALIAPTVLGLAIPSTDDVAALKRSSGIEEKRTPAVETATNWDKDDDDAVAYAWYEEESSS